MNFPWKSFADVDDFDLCEMVEWAVREEKRWKHEYDTALKGYQGQTELPYYYAMAARIALVEESKRRGYNWNLDMSKDEWFAVAMNLGEDGD